MPHSFWKVSWDTNSRESQTVQIVQLSWDHEAGRPLIDTLAVSLSWTPGQQSMPIYQPGKWATLEILLQRQCGHHSYCEKVQKQAKPTEPRPKEITDWAK